MANSIRRLLTKPIKALLEIILIVEQKWEICKNSNFLLSQGKSWVVETTSSDEAAVNFLIGEKTLKFSSSRITCCCLNVLPRRYWSVNFICSERVRWKKHRFCICSINFSLKISPHFNSSFNVYPSQFSVTHSWQVLIISSESI